MQIKKMTSKEQRSKAEKAVEMIMQKIRPTTTAEKNRNLLINYMEELMRRKYGLNVKVIKCIVGDLPMDISFNQIWGISSLCFLENVARMIGRDHLLKESVLLVKSWCYYESRTLGSHASLLSTYGLEILVLYIINVFHVSLTGPLSVLYTFLIYFSSFDWNSNCVGILGPIKKSDTMVQPPIHDKLLITNDKLRSCWDMFFIPKEATENGFEARYSWNIIDPLSKDNKDNNVGRSISKGNSLRLKAAFSYGARKLGRIIREGEQVKLEKELNGFFANTLVHTSRLRGEEEEVDLEPLEGNWFELITNLSTACDTYGYMPPLLQNLVRECKVNKFGNSCS